MRSDADASRVLALCAEQRGAEVCARLVPVLLDVTKPDTIESARQTIAAMIEKEPQPFVALVNNAGIHDFAPLEFTPMTTFRKSKLKSS